MQDIVALIPARSGSKGVPDKNVKLLAGKPLLAYSIAAAVRAKNVDRVIVSTDSDHYANLSLRYGAELPFLRPVEISRDHSSDYEFIKHALDWMKDNESFQPKYLVHLRPTTPLRDPSCIDAAIELINKNPLATALRSVHEMSESAYKTFEMEGAYLKNIFSGSSDLESANRPRQEFKKTYKGNGYVDIIKSSFVISRKKIHGDKVIAYVTPKTHEVDIPEDFEYLEFLVNKNPDLLAKLFR